MYFIVLMERTVEHIRPETLQRISARRRKTNTADLQNSEIEELDLRGFTGQAVIVALKCLSPYAIRYIEKNGDVNDITQIHSLVKTFESIKVLVQSVQNASTDPLKLQAMEQASVAAKNSPSNGTLKLFINAGEDCKSEAHVAVWLGKALEIASIMSSTFAMQLLLQHGHIEAAVTVAHRCRSTASLVFLINLFASPTTTIEVDSDTLSQQMNRVVATSTKFLRKEELLATLESAINELDTRDDATSSSSSSNATPLLSSQLDSLKNMAFKLAMTMDTSNAIVFLIKNGMRNDVISGALEPQMMEQPCSMPIARLLTEFVIEQQQSKEVDDNKISVDMGKLKYLYEFI